MNHGYETPRRPDVPSSLHSAVMRCTLYWWTAAAVLVLVAGERVEAGPNTCPPGTRFCTGFIFSRCVHQQFWCDGWDDCTESYDEVNCTACGPQAFHCDTKCVRSVYKCDGHADCQDGADEGGCDSVPEELFRCRNGVTRRRAALCDGVSDCKGPDDDEKGCSPEACQGGAFWCKRKCHKPSELCDGYPLCDDLDEAHCPDTNVSSPTSATTPSQTAPAAPGETALLVYVLTVSSFLSVVAMAVAVLACVLVRRTREARMPSDTPPEEPEYATIVYQPSQGTSSGAPRVPGPPVPTRPTGFPGTPGIPREPGVPGALGVPGVPQLPSTDLGTGQTDCAVDNPTYHIPGPGSDHDLIRAYDILDYSRD